MCVCVALIPKEKETSESPKFCFLFPLCLRHSVEVRTAAAAGSWWMDAGVEKGQRTTGHVVTASLR